MWYCDCNNRPLDRLTPTVPFFSNLRSHIYYHINFRPSVLKWILAHFKKKIFLPVNLHEHRQFIKFLKHLVPKKKTNDLYLVLWLNGFLKLITVISLLFSWNYYFKIIFTMYYQISFYFTSKKKFSFYFMTTIFFPHNIFD